MLPKEAGRLTKLLATFKKMAVLFFVMSFKFSSFKFDPLIFIQLTALLFLRKFMYSVLVRTHLEKMPRYEVLLSLELWAAAKKRFS